MSAPTTTAEPVVIHVGAFYTVYRCPVHWNLELARAQRTRAEPDGLMAEFTKRNGERAVCPKCQARAITANENQKE